MANPINTTTQPIFLRTNAPDSNVVVYAKQFDSHSRFLKVDVRDSYGRIPFDGLVQLNSLKPDGTYCYSGGVIEDSGTLRFELPSQLLAVVGDVSCDVSIFAHEGATEIFVTTGETSEFVLRERFYSVETVLVDGEPTDEFTYDNRTYTLTFNEAPDSDKTVTVSGIGSLLLTTQKFTIEVDDTNYEPGAIESTNEFSTITVQLSHMYDILADTQAAAEAAEQSAEEIKNLTVSSETLPAGSSATVEKTGGDGEPYNLHFAIPRGDVGPQGPKGDPGEGVDVPVTTNLLKGDGNGNIVEAIPNRDYIDYDRDKQLSMVKSGFRFTARTDYITIAGNENRVHGGTVNINGFQEIVMESPSATLNGEDIATVGNIPTELSALAEDSTHRLVTDAEKADWNDHIENTEIHVTPADKELWDNKGTYSKPEAGIPASDLTEDIQHKLDTLTEHNWYDYKLGAFTLCQFDKDYGTVTDWPTAIAINRVGIGLHNFAQTDWTQGYMSAQMEDIMYVLGRLQDTGHLSVDNTLTYRHKANDLEMLVSVQYNGTTASVSNYRADGASLIATWNFSTQKFTQFSVFYEFYPYTEDGIYLSDTQRAAIRENIGISTELAAYRTAAEQDVIDAEKANKSDVATAAGNWCRYDMGNLGVILYDYLIDGSTITDWPAAIALPSFTGPSVTLGYDLYNITEKNKWDRESVLSLRPRIIEIYNLLKENNLISADLVFYTVRSGFASGPITVVFGKQSGAYTFGEVEYDGRSLVAMWFEGDEDLSAFSINYDHYPYADDVTLSTAQKAAIQSKLGIVSESAIDTKLAQLMRFYEVTVEGPESNLHFVKDGVTLTYDDLVAKYEDPQYFLFVEYQGLTFIPALPPMVGDEILEFTCQWIYGDKVQTSRLIINSDNQVKYETKICAEQSTLHVYTRNTGTLTVTLEDNAEYEFNACYDVHLVFPSTRFESHIRFNFGSTLNVVFPADAHYIGDVPQFEEMTAWEISIKDGVIVAGKVE